MPIKVRLKTYPFVDEDGTTIPDASFTIRTGLSHTGRQEYMAAVTQDMPDLRDAIGPDGKVDPDFKPPVNPELLTRVYRALLKDGLVDLQGVEDVNGKEIKTWEEFLKHESFYVQQVVKRLQEIALSDIKHATPDPNASAPSA